MEMADSFWFLESGLILFNWRQFHLRSLLIEIVFHWTSGCNNILSDWITQTELCPVTKQACEDRDAAFVGSLSQFSVETFHLSEQLSASNWPLSSSPASIRTKYHNNNTITHGFFPRVTINQKQIQINHAADLKWECLHERKPKLFSMWSLSHDASASWSLSTQPHKQPHVRELKLMLLTHWLIMSHGLNFSSVFFSYRQNETTRQSKRREEKSNSVWTER